MVAMRGHVTALGAAIVFAACASARETGRDGAPVFRVSEVDIAPALVGCSSYDPSVAMARGTLSRQRLRPVRVTLVVNWDGSVEAQSVRLISPRQLEPQLEQNVLAMARGCGYQPGQLFGEAVSVRTEATFQIERAVAPVSQDSNRPTPDTVPKGL
jgi:hypothetical protein